MDGGGYQLPRTSICYMVRYRTLQYSMTASKGQRTDLSLERPCFDIGISLSFAPVTPRWESTRFDYCRRIRNKQILLGAKRRGPSGWSNPAWRLSYWVRLCCHAEAPLAEVPVSNCRMAVISLPRQNCQGRQKPAVFCFVVALTGISKSVSLTPR